MNKICLIIGAVLFGIGAISSALKFNSPINWLSAGACMITVAAIVGH